MENETNIKIKNIIKIENLKITIPVTLSVFGIIFALFKIIGGYLNTEGTLVIGDEVIVQNAVATDGKPGVHLRANPGTGSSRKGAVFNGATGKVMKGPEDEDGFRWWKVQWDAGQGENRIRWDPQYPCDEPPCEAWMAEVINGFVVLASKK